MRFFFDQLLDLENFNRKYLNKGTIFGLSNAKIDQTNGKKFS